MKKLILTITTALLFAGSASADLTTPGNYKIDSDHTNVGFSVGHFGVSQIIGRFNTVSGSVIFDPAGVSQVNVTIDVNSIDTNQERRDNHLRSADFFDTATHPNMNFKSTSVKLNKDNNPESLTGILTLHGVSKEITLDAKLVGANSDSGKFRMGFSASSTIKRSDFGMTNLIPVASDEVKLNIEVEVIKQ